VQWYVIVNITHVRITINSRNVCRSRTLCRVEATTRDVAMSVTRIVEMGLAQSHIGALLYSTRCDHDQLPLIGTYRISEGTACGAAFRAVSLVARAVI